MRTGPSERRFPLGAVALAMAFGFAASGGALAAAAPAAAQPDTTRAARTLEQFQRSCVLCHVTGEGGAPRMGDTAAWAPRLAQGEAVLLQHAIEGYRNMPPLGYCQDCEARDLRALVELMSRGAPPTDTSASNGNEAHP